ncbi:MAG: DUF3040 domain-containing protein [Actinomycetota bacterium]|nr:DUF3040 domain-containing protein [Acidimicrobiales bacterium]MEC7874732.1 DUF3040 domain-containing protein [Actinomycetota bacterium]MCS5683146.1 DUF3040 domain-containing protein [Acidimicrobiales bacterium]MEC8829106.1 DUF3040 domain-containing protein [Actinomycetota bacterium]MEC8977253.1 DUF3040 domain-containing protein [Actinomycetota bacterium]
MPLSDDEQRILHQIEKEFYDSDPEFAREVSETTLYRHALRSIKWAVIVGVAGIIGVIATLQIHFGLAFVAFLAMFVCAVVIERNLRKMGKAGFQKVTGQVRSGQMRANIGGLSERMRNRMRRDDL